ncbi:MAG: diguanylate cyclase, partial [Actinocatenispora sp.]
MNSRSTLWGLGTGLRLRALIGLVWLAGLIVACAALASADHSPQPFRFLAAVGLFAVTQFTRTQIRVGSERVVLPWGEVALIIGLCLLAWHWVIPALLLGVFAGALLSGLPTVKAFYNATACALSAATGVGVAGLVGNVETVPPLDVRNGTALAVAAVVYWLVSAVFASLAVALAHGGPMREVLLREVILRNLGAKLLILVGNIVVGLLAVGMGLADFRYLAFAPPLLWLLYETYQARMKAGEERRAWQELATTLHALSRLDVPAVVQAAVVGAQRLFSPDAVELTLCWPGSPDRHYLARPGNPLATVVEEGVRQDGEPAPSVDGDAVPPVVRSRKLVMGSDTVGEFRLRFRRPMPFGEREQLAFSAFADALAAALHNAASHGQLREMAERKAYEADHDMLTGLANRTRLLEYGDERLRPVPDGTAYQVALLLLDLNHFSDVNDTLGHT